VLRKRSHSRRRRHLARRAVFEGEALVRAEQLHEDGPVDVGL
jgi:hypothetical protein